MNLRESFYEHLHNEFLNNKKWLGDCKSLQKEDFGDSLSKSMKDNFYINKQCLTYDLLPNLKRNGKIPYFDRYRCVGSSARFVYSVFNKIPDVQFEWTISAGMVRPHLDAFFTYDGTEYYVEGKCAEIYDKPSLNFRVSFLECTIFHNFLKEFCEITETQNKKSELFGGKSIEEFIESLNQNSKNHKTFKLHPSDFGIKGTFVRFDFKQFICHIIGIVYGKSKYKDIKLKEDNFHKRLVYLYYDDNWEVGKAAIQEFINEFERVEKGFSYFLESKNIELSLIGHDEFAPIDLEKLKENIKSKTGLNS